MNIYKKIIVILFVVTNSVNIFPALSPETEFCMISLDGVGRSVKDLKVGDDVEVYKIRVGDMEALEGIVENLSPLKVRTEKGTCFVSRYNGNRKSIFSGEFGKKVLSACAEMFGSAVLGVIFGYVASKVFAKQVAEELMAAEAEAEGAPCEEKDELEDSVSTV